MEKLGLIGIPGFVVKLRSFATALLHGIRNMPDDANAAEAWMLTLADQTLVMTKNGANRLGFAVLLLFYTRRVLGGGDVKLLAVVSLWVDLHCALLFSVLLFVLICLHLNRNEDVLGW